MSRRSTVILVLAAAVLVGSLAAMMLIGSRDRDVPTYRPTAVPITPKEPISTPPPVTDPEPRLPSSVSLDVPFLVQAPFGRWDAIRKEACEEASLLMVKSYKTKKPLGTLEVSDQELVSFIAWQTENGYKYDVTVAELQQAASDYYGFNGGTILQNPTIEALKKELADGNPIIVPAAGRLLPNPYFTPPGPNYHMLVIIGYDEDEFITHDPGTRRGERFAYQYNDLLRALHDYDPDEITAGKKVVLVYR